MKRGLQHRDYDHVVHIILQYSKERSPFTRHCHRILCEEINKSQTHVENVIKAAGKLKDKDKEKDNILNYQYDIVFPTIPFPSLPTREDWTYQTVELTEKKEKMISGLTKTK